MQYIQKQPQLVHFLISFNRNSTFAAIRHVSWVLNTPKMRLRPGLG